MQLTAVGRGRRAQQRPRRRRSSASPAPRSTSRWSWSAPTTSPTGSSRPTAVRHLDHAVRRLRRARRPGRRRHLPRPRHRRAGAAAAALDRPAREPPAGRRADDRRGRGGRPDGLARRHPRAGVRGVAEGDVRPGPLPPVGDRLRQRRRRDAAVGRARRWTCGSAARPRRPRTSAAARASGRSRWPRWRPPRRPAPRSPRPRSAAGTAARAAAGRCSAAGRGASSDDVAGHRRGGRAAAVASWRCYRPVMSVARDPGGPRARGSDRRHRAHARSAAPSRARWSASARTTWPPPSCGPRWTRCRRSTRPTLDDLMLGCAEPEGEQGVNMARRVAVALGYDSLPGTTVNRFCASSVQTSRMAFHAIKAGEGARVRRRPASSACRATRRSAAPARAARSSTTRSSTRPGRAPTATAASNETWHDPRAGRPAARRLHRDGPDRREPRHLARHQPPGAGRVRRALAEPRREGDRGRLLRPRDHAGDDARRHGGQPRTTARGRASTLEGVAGLKPVFRADGTVTAGNCCPLNDGAAAVVIMSDTRAGRARADAAGPDRRRPACPACRPRSWGSDRSRRPGGRWRCAGMTIGDMDLVEINEAFAAQVIPSYQELGIDLDRLNVHGGAIALGHPFGMTGARITTTLLNGLQTARQGVRPRDHVRRRRPGHGDGPAAPELTARLRAAGGSRRGSRPPRRPRRGPVRRAAGAQTASAGSRPSSAASRSWPVTATWSPTAKSASSGGCRQDGSVAAARSSMPWAATARTRASLAAGGGPGRERRHRRLQAGLGEVAQAVGDPAYVGSQLVAQRGPVVVRHARHPTTPSGRDLVRTGGCGTPRREARSSSWFAESHWRRRCPCTIPRQPTSSWSSGCPQVTGRDLPHWFEADRERSEPAALRRAGELAARRARHRARPRLGDRARVRQAARRPPARLSRDARRGARLHPEHPRRDPRHVPARRPAAALAGRARASTRRAGSRSRPGRPRSRSRTCGATRASRCA